VKVAGAKNILVLGHTRCGAIESARVGDGVSEQGATDLGPNIKALLSRVHTGDSDDLDICTVNNVINTSDALRRSELLASAIYNNEVRISDAVYDASTRPVTFL